MMQVYERNYIVKLVIARSNLTIDHSIYQPMCAGIITLTLQYCCWLVII